MLLMTLMWDLLYRLLLPLLCILLLLLWKRGLVRIRLFRDVHVRRMARGIVARCEGSG